MRKASRRSKPGWRARLPLTFAASSFRPIAMGGELRGVIALALSGLLACGGGDDRGDAGEPSGDDAAAGGESADARAGGEEDVICTVTASSEADVEARTITAEGGLRCSGHATLSLETCVQWDASGEFENIQCFTSIQSGVDELEVETVASCGISPGRLFRARVSASVDDDDLPEELSATHGCD